MSYQKISTEAAEYERKGNFKLAALLWAKAASIANKGINREYALTRESFCLKNRKDA